MSEAVDRLAECSCVLAAGDFAGGLAGLAHRLELPLTPRRERVTGSRSVLTDNQRERLRTRLEPEYELLRRLDRAGITATGPTRAD